LTENTGLQQQSLSRQPRISPSYGQRAFGLRHLETASLKRPHDVLFGDGLAVAERGVVSQFHTNPLTGEPLEACRERWFWLPCSVERDQLFEHPWLRDGRKRRLVTTDRGELPQGSPHGDPEYERLPCRRSRATDDQGEQQ